MTVIRAFIAIDLSEDITSRLDQISGELKQRVPQYAIRWVPARNIHLTLKFLGDVSTANLESLHKAIQSACENIQSFDISVGGMGAFPSAHRPRVVWVGVTAPENLTHLVRKIELSASRLGYPLEERSFSPHLTLGRVSRNVSPADLPNIAKVISGYNIGSLGTAHVPAVHLYRSDLSPAGARYTRLFSVALKPAAQE
jgi:2'-5' RNA ligase